MFEQSMLLSSAPGKKVGALAVSLAGQTLAVGALLLIPLLYTDRLPFAQLQLPTFLPRTPAPEPLKPQATPHRRIVANVRNPFIAPTTIPPLNTQPEIIDYTPAQLDRIDTGVFLPPNLGTIVSRVLPPPPPPPHVNEVEPSKPVTVTSDVPRS
jgi:hypothetical protein